MIEFLAGAATNEFLNGSGRPRRRSRIPEGENLDKSTLSFGTGGDEPSSSPTHSYADGVRMVLDILDKHRVDIEKALWYGKHSHTYNDICEKVITGKLIFIPLPNSVMICEVSTQPQHKTFHCFIAAGDLDELSTVGTKQLEDAAIAYECRYISVVGRRGWERTLKKQGWDAPLVVMYKEVTQ